MKSLMSLVVFSIAAVSAQAAGVAIGPIGGGGGGDTSTTTVVMTGDQVTMESQVFNGADSVNYQIKTLDGAVIYSGNDTPDSSGLVEFTWFPLFDGTYVITAESFSGGSSLGTQLLDISTSVRPEATGFITGGGWFNVGNQKDNFGFNAQVLGNGNVKGNLEFQDRSLGKNVKSTSVDWVYAPNCTKGYFSGWCKINGAGNYRFMVEVDDLGEPGTWDRMNLWVYDAVTGNLIYSYSGQLNGGNIQIHCRL